MFSIRREQGRLAELAPVIRILAGDAEPRRAVAARASSRVLVELGMEAEARRELARVVADGLDPFRESLWLASLTYLTDACAALGDEAIAALVYPELEPLAGHERDDRPPRRLLRRGRPLPGHARGDARRVGARGGALRARHGAQPAHGCRDLAGPHAPTSTRACCWRAGPASAIAPSALLGEAAALAERIGMPALLGRDPGARLRGAGGQRAARRPLAARGRDPGPRRPGPQQPRDRRRRC